MGAATHRHVAPAHLVEQVRAAAAARRALAIRAGGTKDFYGNPSSAERLDPRECTGIVAYEPSELVITARCGTRLADVESALGASGQMLAFEPPHFGAAATIGGCVAAGLAGPRRAASGVAGGGVRDSVLGAKLLDGRGEVLSFGGTVIKNVAGYDASRLLAGSLGTLGVLLEVSLRVVPQPALEATVGIELSEVAALAHCQSWSQAPWPVSATAWHAGRLHVRLSGASAAVEAARRAFGGEPIADGEARIFWSDVREHAPPFFADAPRLWRISVPPAAPALGLPGEQLIEWGGGLRWLASGLGAEAVRSRAAALGGHATLFKGDRAGIEAFTAPSAAIAQIEARLRAQFDPAGIFNPGRMHANPAR
jgi:glycolate oxidase FAD binding subunit